MNAGRMDATIAALREARTALGHFLRGFFGAALLAPENDDNRCDHRHSGPAPSPASVRDALTAQAARRGRCC